MKILSCDPMLKPYRADLMLRKTRLEDTLDRILSEGQTLSDFATGHLYFGFHKTEDGWYYREWAPGAEKMFLTGDFCNWERYAYQLEKKENGVFELFLPGKDTLKTGTRVMAIVCRNGLSMERIPLYIHRVEQTRKTIAGAV